MLIVLELIPDLYFMSQIALNFALKLLRNRVFLRHPPQDAKFSLQFLAAFANGGDDTADFADIVGEDD
jgi:hypothetical protein